MYPTSSADPAVRLLEPHLSALADQIAERIIGVPPAPLLTQAQTAAWLNVGERTIDLLVASGELAPIRLTSKGRGRRFAPDAVAAFIRSRTGGR